MEALDIIKAEKITFLLAVGGGSVIDGTKFLSAAALYEGEEPWDILVKNIRTLEGMPFGTVLTLPATGSEMNSGAVILSLFLFFQGICAVGRTRKHDIVTEREV